MTLLRTNSFLLLPKNIQTRAILRRAPSRGSCRDFFFSIYTKLLDSHVSLDIKLARDFTGFFAVCRFTLHNIFLVFRVHVFFYVEDYLYFVEFEGHIYSEALSNAP